MKEEFRDKLERILEPKIEKLSNFLKSVSLHSILEHYQFRLDLSGSGITDGYPDGFWAKWRYIWALRVGFDPVGREGQSNDWKIVDEQVENIFDIYGFGAIYEPGKDRSSEPEFLARLGLGLRAREIDALAYPEQIRRDIQDKFSLFDTTYFIPTYGLKLESILSWIDSHLKGAQQNLNELIDEFQSIRQQAESFGAIANPTLEDNLRLDALQRKIDSNGEKLSSLHIFDREKLSLDLEFSQIERMIDKFQIDGSFGTGKTRVLFPHDENPLSQKFLIKKSDTSWYFLDPSYTTRVCKRVFEKDILAREGIRERYLRNRDKQTENRVIQALSKLSPPSFSAQNFFLTKGSAEKDVLFRSGDTVVLVECKNYKIRDFLGKSSDLARFQNDFKESVQFGYEQALETKQFIFQKDEAVFLDKKGNHYFSIKKQEIKEIFIVCIAENPRGPLGTDLSYFLRKNPSEPFPLAMRLFDFETICQRLVTADRLIAYLKGRETLHGRVITGDELNCAGYFLRFGNLEMPRGMLDDDFSKVVDNAWYREQGISIEDPSGPPSHTEMIRVGNIIRLRDSRTGKILDRIDIPPNHPSHLKKLKVDLRSVGRNSPCPCGSGLKFKKCHGN